MLKDELYDYGAASPVRAAYVHVPFCARKCLYCDFISRKPGRGDFSAYSRALLHEIDQQAAWYRQQAATAPLTSVYFGGGTPSLLPVDQLLQILDHLHEQFTIAPDAEVTVEINPATYSHAELNRLFQAGSGPAFNRASIGFQAKQDKLLQTLGRLHKLSDFDQLVNDLRASSCHNFSCDLMFGLPGQSLADLEESLDYLLTLGIQHISYYSLILEEGTSFADYYGAKPDLLPSEDEEREMYYLANRMVQDRGFIHYEISNASLPGYQAKHNTSYWLAKPYFAFGPGAHSYLCGVRRGNSPDINKWLAAWQEPVGDDLSFRTVEYTEEIDAYESARETMMLGLRLLEGVDRKAFGARYHVDPTDLFASEISNLIDQGLIEKAGDFIRLTTRGLDLANLAFAEFVG